jgi:hypothetical protein
MPPVTQEAEIDRDDLHLRFAQEKKLARPHLNK